MAFGLLPQLKKSFLDLDVWQSVYPTQLIDADFGHLMLSCNMRKSIDNPGRLVIPTVGIRIAGNVVCLGGEKAKVCPVYQLENMLSPCHKVLPSIDVVPHVW